MQLVAFGAQDKFLTGNPQMTFFKFVYRRHTNFSMETIPQVLDGAQGDGIKRGNAICNISRDGDLVHKIYVTSDSSSTCTNGSALIKKVELEIGGQIIDCHYQEWNEVWNELTTPESKAVGLKAMQCEIGTGSNGAADTVQIPLNFWFCRNPGLALPLVALQYHEVLLKFTWGDSGGDGLNPRVWCDYIYLDVDERRRFAKNSHEYLIEQVQRRKYSSGIGDKKLKFNHPVKELIWTNTKQLEKDIKYQLIINGHDRFHPQPKEYFMLRQPYDHHTAIPSQNLPASAKSNTTNTHTLLCDIFAANNDEDGQINSWSVTPGVKIRLAVPAIFQLSVFYPGKTYIHKGLDMGIEFGQVSDVNELGGSSNWISTGQTLGARHQNWEEVTGNSHAEVTFEDPEGNINWGEPDVSEYQKLGRQYRRGNSYDHYRGVVTPLLWAIRDHRFYFENTFTPVESRSNHFSVRQDVYNDGFVNQTYPASSSNPSKVYNFGPFDPTSDTYTSDSDGLVDRGILRLGDDVRPIKDWDHFGDVWMAPIKGRTFLPLFAAERESEENEKSKFNTYLTEQVEIHANDEEENKIDDLTTAKINAWKERIIPTEPPQQHDVPYPPNIINGKEWYIQGELPQIFDNHHINLSHYYIRQKYEEYSKPGNWRAVLLSEDVVKDFAVGQVHLIQYIPDANKGHLKVSSKDFQYGDGTPDTLKKCELEKRNTHIYEGDNSTVNYQQSSMAFYNGVNLLDSPLNLYNTLKDEHDILRVDTNDNARYWPEETTKPVDGVQWSSSTASREPEPGGIKRNNYSSKITIAKVVYIGDPASEIKRDERDEASNIFIQNCLTSDEKEKARGAFLFPKDWNGDDNAEYTSISRPVISGDEVQASDNYQLPAEVTNTGNWLNSTHPHSDPLGSFSDTTPDSAPNLYYDEIYPTHSSEMATGSVAGWRKSSRERKVTTKCRIVEYETDIHTGVDGYISPYDKLIIHKIGDEGCRTSKLSKEINVYSFALRPEEHQPSGTCNFSKIDKAHLRISGSSDGGGTIYAVNYNILKITSGMGGLAFSN